MLKINISKKAQEFLNSIPAKHYKQILSKIEKIAENENNVPSIKLKGYTKFKRAKCGEYRIIFYIENDILILEIVLIDKRNDDKIYKEFSRTINN